MKHLLEFALKTGLVVTIFPLPVKPWDKSGFSIRFHDLQSDLKIERSYTWVFSHAYSEEYLKKDLSDVLKALQVSMAQSLVKK